MGDPDVWQDQGDITPTKILEGDVINRLSAEYTAIDFKYVANQNDSNIIPIRSTDLLFVTLFVHGFT